MGEVKSIFSKKRKNDDRRYKLQLMMKMADLTLIELTEQLELVSPSEESFQKMLTRAFFREVLGLLQEYEETGDMKVDELTTRVGELFLRYIYAMQLHMDYQAATSEI